MIVLSPKKCSAKPKTNKIEKNIRLLLEVITLIDERTSEEVLFLRGPLFLGVLCVSVIIPVPLDLNKVYLKQFHL